MTLSFNLATVECLKSLEGFHSLDKTATYELGCFPLRTVAFRGHGFSLLAPSRGMPTLSAKDGFSRPSSLPPLRGLQTRAGTAITRPTEDICSRRSQRSSAPNNHCNRGNQLYSFVSKLHVSEGKTRRLLEKENRFFCVRCISKKPYLSCGKAKTMRPRSVLCEEAHREPAESVVYFP